MQAATGVALDRQKADLIIHALLQSMLVWSQSTVCRSQLLLQTRWRDLIQPQGKVGQVVSVTDRNVWKFDQLQAE